MFFTDIFLFKVNSYLECELGIFIQFFVQCSECPISAHLKLFTSNFLLKLNKQLIISSNHYLSTVTMEWSVGKSVC